MDAMKVLNEYKLELEPKITKYFRKEVSSAKKISPDSVFALEQLEEFTLRGGKRLRAALLYYTYKMFGGKDIEAAKDASIAMELLQSYILIHDDIVDQAGFRRGKPSLHKIYEEEHRRNYQEGSAAKFGESMAIFVGDLGVHMSMVHLAKADFPSERKCAAIDYLNRQITTVYHGQILDLMATVREVSIEDVEKIHIYKTSTYTYETPMYVGALLAGASEGELSLLSKYAIPAGIAFQIQDDILGLFGDEYKLGKSNISDLKEGKQTLLILKALQECSKQEAQVITKALGNRNISQRQAKKVREIVESTGSLEYSKRLARKHVNKAKHALGKMPNWNGEGRAFLDGIADYMINREL